MIIRPYKYCFMTILLLLFLVANHPASVCAGVRLEPQSNAEPVKDSKLYPEWWGDKPSAGNMVDCKGQAKCVSCHLNNSKMDPVHAFACDKCHAGDVLAEDKDEAHKGLIKDPGSLDSVDRTCGKCHAEIAQKVKISPMAISPRMINQTLFAFGLKECLRPVYGTVDCEGIKELPDPSSFMKNISQTDNTSDLSGNLKQFDIAELTRNLGADLLRRSCLRCHLNTEGSQRAGESRGKGCSACHVAYSNTTEGRPSFHAIVRNAGITACLKCHNSNHVGSDFVGLYEKDHNRGFKSPVISGHQAQSIYGSEQHRLIPDAHYRAGMSCVDCHVLEEIHGTGKPIENLSKNIAISCKGCHLSHNHPRLFSDSDGKAVLLGNRERNVPVWSANIVPHNIKSHGDKLSCSSCHAAWSFQDYGFHLMLDERNEYWKWSINASQNDPQVQSLLKYYTGDYAELIPPKERRQPNLPEEKWSIPESFDWLSNESRTGIWYRGWTLRRWSNPPLGLDSDGSVSILRPMHQYVISYVNRNDNVVLDRSIPVTGAGNPALIVNPYTPHTTSPMGRACYDCHGSYKAVGMGETLKGLQDKSLHPLIKPEDQIPQMKFRWDAFTDQGGTHLQHSLYPKPAGPLDKKTLETLLNPSSKLKAAWSNLMLGRDTMNPELKDGFKR